ncbi:acyl carrier protein [Gloeobacter kilaueensis]|uniref:Acyl carrier protein n=1 Tax=Gloeobacter kilaueensis (strain ATCC BAA-2537 / CCAP 1431/1 / ULC 316 / JS1) TaxID=1183438 RepID=U5QLP3_GLOK1|nr:phosphopantetheine-binding protein [Gloeobacter kilaueensis]AGY59897.1 acyl carrier protein [Gloeobacter kilaueensis JS1]
MTVTLQKVETEIIEILDDMTQDWDLEVEEITPKTSLVNELEFASIDYVQLVVAIEEHFGRKLDFSELILNDGKYVSDISVAELVNFVTRKLNQD